MNLYVFILYSVLTIMIYFLLIKHILLSFEYEIVSKSISWHSTFLTATLKIMIVFWLIHHNYPFFQLRSIVNVSYCSKCWFQFSSLFFTNRWGTNHVHWCPIRETCFFIVWLKYPVPNNTDRMIHISQWIHQLN